MTEMDQATQDKFRVSVIIPVLNDELRLMKCLDAIAAQSWPRDQLEVLVVDNGSRNDPAPCVERYDFARLLREVTPGSYAARNAALAEATGNVLAFTDSDCIPEPQWLEQGVLALSQHGPNAVVGGRVVLFARDSRTPTLAEDFELSVGFSQRTYVEQRHYSVTANLFTTPHVMQRVGPFNAELKSGGDKEWGLRAHRAGVRLVYSDNALVRHPARRTMRELLAKRARLVGGHLGMARSRHSRWVAFALVLGKACLPPLARLGTARKRQSSATSGGQRHRRLLRVFAVGVTLQVFSVGELCRLQFGGLPRR